MDPAQASLMREDQVANAVRFLTNDKVVSASQDQKMGFLRKKGLTEEEIQESIRRAGGAGAQAEQQWGAGQTLGFDPAGAPPQPLAPAPMPGAGALAMGGQPMAAMGSPPMPGHVMAQGQMPGMGMPGPMMPYPYMPPVPGPAGMPGMAGVAERSIFAPVALFTGLAAAAAGAYAFWRSRMAPASDSSVRAAVAELKTAQDTLAADQRRSADELQGAVRALSADLRELIAAVRAQEQSQMRNHTQSLHAVHQLQAAVQAKHTVDVSKASVDAIAAALAAALGSAGTPLPAAANGALRGGPVEDGAHADSGKAHPTLNGAPPDTRTAMEAVVAKIGQEVEGKPEEKKVLKLLLLIFQNLLNDPEQDRYRKVNTSSTRFRERFGSQSSAAEMLRLAGFQEENGSFVFSGADLEPPRMARVVLEEALQDDRPAVGAADPPPPWLAHAHANSPSAPAFAAREEEGGVARPRPWADTPAHPAEAEVHEVETPIGG